MNALDLVIEFSQLNFMFQLVESGKNNNKLLHASCLEN